MGDKGFIFCACQGMCTGFTRIDIFQVLSRIRETSLFDYVCLHPQLCARDGEEFLTILLSGGQTEKLYIAACDPQMQEKMYRDAFEVIDFNKLGHASTDIRKMTTDEAVVTITDMVKRNCY
jgi:heterodisulfide reductase subunit A-like polyferredoxin